MTRHLHIDPVAGVSGDMLLGGLIDVGVSIDALRHEIGKLDIEGWSLDVERVTRHGLTGTLATVRTDDHAPHRAASELVDIVACAGLDPIVAMNAIAVVRRIADVEATIHAIPVDEVHFHEVGALDTLIDVVGVCAAVRSLGVDTVGVAPLPTGAGSVSTAHGELPVPAPATLGLIAGTGIRWRVTDDPMELVTPTGAAIVAHFGRPACGSEFDVEAVGYGFGTSTRLARANVCRLVLGSALSARATDQVIELSAVIDDQSPEHVADAAETLLARGVVDVWTAPVVMKKGRLGVELTVLCRPEDEDGVVAAMFELTTTLGMRRSERSRHIADRCEVTVDIDGHPVRVKLRAWQGVVLGAKAEHADCARTAAVTGVATAEVARRAAERAWPSRTRQQTESGPTGHP